MKVLTVITIGTGEYINFVKFNLPRWIACIDFPGEVKFLVLTDRPYELHGLNPNVSAVQLKQAPWPEITLFRYEYLNPILEALETTHVLWLDADMGTLGKVDLSFLSNSESVWLAKHPGYCPAWPTSMSGLFSTIKSYVHAMVFEHQLSLGTWERRRKSLAFVPSRKRKTYVHGAVWGGGVSAVRKMSAMLAIRTKRDFEGGIVARWHDESHLNYFASTSNPRYFPDGFSAWEGSPWFSAQRASFLSQDKGQLRKFLEENT